MVLGLPAQVSNPGTHARSVLPAPQTLGGAIASAAIGLVLPAAVFWVAVKLKRDA